MIPLLRTTALPRRRRRPAPAPGSALVVLVAAFVLTGCDDAGTDPLEGLVADDTDAAAVALGLPLPTPQHAAAAGEEASAAFTAWQLSWDRDLAEGRRIREPLYAALAAALDARLDRDDVAEEVQLLAGAVRRASTLSGDDLPAYVVDGVQRARGSSAAARAALSRGDEATALLQVLRGADALREVGPEAVARTVVSEAEALFRRIEGDGSYSRTDAERVSRLVRGSRHALEEGDWGLAIRRAYYAKGLMTPGE